MEKDTHHWALLCNLEAIPTGDAKGFEINGHKIFAVNKQGKIFVYRNSCPHLGINLEWVENQFLDSSKTMIQCANHGALFVIDSGSCVAGPCAGRKLQAITYRIENQGLFISLRDLGGPGS